MRLIRCQLVSVRRHQELELEFDPGITLIGGDNESGKSSLVEALHRTLFVRAASSGMASQDLRSHIHAGHPQIKIEFESKDHDWTLLKRFSGPSGTTQLAAKGQPALIGSAAEDQLSDLLGVNEILTSRQVNKTLPSRWAHLWVKQGDSGLNLLSLGHDYYDLDSLIECLEQQAEQSLQSPLDQRVYNQLERLVSESLSTRGVRQQSVLWKRQEALKAAKQQHFEALEQLHGFEASCQELDSIEQELKDLEQERLPEIRRQRKDLSQLQEALQRLRPLTLQYQHLERSFKSLRHIAADCTTYEKKLNLLEQELKDREQNCILGKNQLIDSYQRTEQLEHNQQVLEEKGLMLRQIKDRNEVQRRIQICSHQDNERQRLIEQQRNINMELTAFQGGSNEELLELTKTRDELRAVTIRIESMASQVLVESTDQAIYIDGSTLQQGDVCEQAGIFRIDVGDSVRLKISPGEGTGLSSLQEKQRRLQKILKTGLQHWKSSSIEEAQQRNERRQHLHQQRALVKAQLTQLNASPETADMNLNDLHTRLDELNKVISSNSFKSDTGLEVELEQCRQDYRELKEQTKTHQKYVHSLEVQQKDQQQQWQQKRIHQERLKAEQEQRYNQRQLIEEEAGSQAQLEQSMQDLRSQKIKLEEHIQVLLLPIPTQWQSDPKAALLTLDRLEQQFNEQRLDLVSRRGALYERCDSLGQSDLHSAVSEASVKLELAEQAEQKEALLVRARSYLLERFQKARSDLSQRYSAPLKNNIDQVLKPLLKDTSQECSLTYDERNGLQKLALLREGTLFEFHQLSGGMKEQLNAAVRIAIADTLKERHDGCVPLLFDDAFTNTDAKRLHGVLAMLQKAVQRGLQVIILSCDPEPYKAIANKVIMID